MNEMIRINNRIPSELNDWLENESSRIGISKNAVVMLAIENYKREKDVIKGMADMGALMEKMEQLEQTIQRSDPE